jgi:Spy/CpxP family protein refolding chaperone
MAMSSTVLRAPVLVVLLMACATPAFAQRGKWWQDKEIQTELGLTIEQSTRLEEIFQKTQPTLRERMRALNLAEEEFDRRVETGDDASVMEFVGTVEAARAEVSKTRTLMLLRMRRSLTADQWAKFTALAADRGRGRPTRQRR